MILKTKTPYKVESLINLLVIIHLKKISSTPSSFKIIYNTYTKSYQMIKNYYFQTNNINMFIPIY